MMIYIPAGLGKVAGVGAVSQAERPIDSAEGIAYLLKWAAAHKMVLSPAHRDIADKWGVPTDGVIFSGIVPNIALVDRLPV